MENEMTSISVETVLRQILCDVFLLKNTEISSSLYLSDIETWDSLGFLSLTVAIEEELGCKIDKDDVPQLKTFGDVLSLVESRRFEQLTSLHSGKLKRENLKQV